MRTSAADRGRASPTRPLRHASVPAFSRPSRTARYEELPTAAYVKGFIQSYAAFLELDAAPLLELYRAEGGGKREGEAIRLPEPVMPSRAEAHYMPLRTWATILGAVLVVALLVWGGGRLTRRASTVPPIPRTPTGSASPAATGSPSPAPAASTDASGEAVPGEPFTLRIDVAEGQASWLRVTVDGLKAYEGTLDGPAAKEWQVTSRANVRVGRPSAVSVSRDGELVKVPSSAGISQVTLTAAP